MKKLLVLLVVMGVTVVLSASQTSVSQFGITWTFDKAYEVGQFANGDWWVKGPVTVQSVSPAPSGGRNGSMINPAPNTNAFDDRVGNWNAGLGVSFPKVVQADQSLVSCISNPEASDCMAGPHPGWSDDRGHCYLGKMKTAAVLTCVSEAKPATSFRPPWCGSSYKPYFSKNDICWNLLPKLAAPPVKPTGTNVLRDFERPWIDHFTGWSGRMLHPTMNLPDYGREIGNLVSQGALYLMLDMPDVEQVAIRYIQLGIDNYGIVKAGGAWGVDGGHLNGRKWPTVFAGMMLDDAAMKSPGKYANEDGFCYYGKPTTEYPGGKPLWGAPCPSSMTDNYVYDSGSGCWDLKSGSSGSKTCRDPNGVYEPCAYRLCCTSGTWIGEALAGRIMRAEPHWGNNAFFDYVDRYMKEGGLGANFPGQMWLLYRNNLPPATVCSNGITSQFRPSSIDNIVVSIFPNPTRDHSEIRISGYQGISLPVVRILDSHGRVIRSIKGPGSLRWEGTDEHNQKVKPGIYFYSVNLKGAVSLHRVVKY